MDVDRYRKVKAIVAQAETLPPGKRTAFIQESCGNDASLKAEIGEMLALGDDEMILFEKPLLQLSFKQDPLMQPGSVMDGYSIVRELGLGGMGAVYLAEQTDGGICRNVALKILKRGMDTDEIVRQFQNERKILANLNHPNIARLLTVGTTPSGLPYFAMDYVDGQPLQTYCDERQVSVVERLKLFKKICETVHAAHQNLVIHRDLKPGNILVTAEGVPMLLDFGIAKMMNPENQAAVTATLMGNRAMTPEYASPEQVMGEVTTTATDIYSLGIILYELLCGRRPYDVNLKGIFSDAMVDKVCETNPPKMSSFFRNMSRSESQGFDPQAASSARRSSPSKMLSLLVGDLDHLVLVALRKEPSRRYTSAAQFAEEIDRYLKGFPLLVRKDSFFYPWKKFIGRNRWRLSFCTIGILLSFAFFQTLGFHRQQTRVAKDEAVRAQVLAKQESRQATETALFLAGMFQLVADRRDQEKSLDYISLLAAAEATIRQDHPVSSETRATLLTVLGDAGIRFGDFSRAESLFKEAYKYRLTEQPPNRARICQLLGYLGSCAYSKGELNKAEAYYQQALGILSQKQDLNVTDIGILQANLGAVYLRMGKLEKAEKFLIPGIAMIERTSESVISLANKYQVWGALLTRRGQFQEAEKVLLQAESLKIGALGMDSTSLGSTWNLLGILYNNWGYFEKAELNLKKTLARTEIAHGKKHHNYVKALGNLASLYTNQNKPDQALSLHDMAFEITRELYPDQGLNVISKNNMAMSFMKMGRIEEAETIFRQVLFTLSRDHEQQGRIEPIVLHNLAVLLRDRGDYLEAVQFFEKSKAIGIAIFGKDSPPAARIYTNYGKCLRLMANWSEAKAYLSQALTIRLQHLGPDHNGTANTYFELAMLAFDTQDLEEAIGMCKLALAIREKNGAEDNPKLLATKSLLAELIETKTRPDNAATFVSVDK